MRVQEIIGQLERSWAGSGRVEDVGSFATIEAALGSRLPADYKFFLMWSDGGETLPPLERYRFYPLQELLDRRADGQPPDVLEFATDDSEGFAFDLLANRDTAKYPIVRYPLGDTERVEVERMGEDFGSFLMALLHGSNL